MTPTLSRNLLLLLIVNILFTPSTPAVADEVVAVASDVQPPSLRLPDDWRPLRYAVDLTVKPAVEVFHGSVAIDVQIQRRTDLLWLHAQELGIEGVTVTSANSQVSAVASSHGKDLLAIRLARPVAPGPAEIRIKYSGHLDDTDTHGLFRQQDHGDWYVFSQFEPTSARRAVPCFDEPGHKIPWQVTLTVPRALVAVSNTREVKSVDAGDGMKTVMFAETKPLPSYLLALAVGAFDVVEVGKVGRNAIPLRILTTRGMGDQAAYAASITPELFNRVETYFGIPYPYDKLDEVTIPQTVSFGAMENPGLITYSSAGLLSPPDDLTISQKRRLANTTAHEIAHQWFGNLVTMEYWDDIWLNEGFATWLASKVVDSWRPEWDGAVSAVARRGWVMDSDSLVTARKVRQPIEVAGDIENAFDGITYGKGGATLAMFESWLGADRFRAGIRRYLTLHAFGNATSDDFLAALSTETRAEVGAAFATFLTQPGLPLLTVELVCGDESGSARLKLTQKRFLPTGSTGSTELFWQLPVCVRWSLDGEERRTCRLMSGAQMVFDLKSPRGCPDWVLANDRAMGYYRTEYRGDLLSRLLTNAAGHLALAERVGVLSDVTALARSGGVSMAEVLALVPVFSGAENRHLVNSAAAMVASVDDELVPDELRANYARFVNKMFGARAHQLGFVATSGEDEDTQLLRERLVALVADLGEDHDLRVVASRLARQWLDTRSGLDPNMVSTVLELAAIEGDQDLFDRLYLAAVKTEDRRERRRLFSAMGSFRNPAIATHALGLVLSKEVDIREAITIVWSLLGRRDTRMVAWRYLEANFAALKERMPREALPRLASTARSFCDEQGKAAAESFLRANLGDVPGAMRNLNQAVESATLCIAQKNAQSPSVAEFLKSY